MHHTSAKPTRAAESAVIFSAPPTSVIHPTMEPSSTSPKYSRLSCPVQPKQNYGHYSNTNKAVPMRQLLAEMGHKQPKTPIQTDNTTACGVVNHNIQPQRTKALDMHFHWLRCCDFQGQLRYYWGPGIKNRADYWTKHHCAAHDIEKRTEILTSKFILNALQASIQRTPATTSKGLIKTNIAAPAA